MAKRVRVITSKDPAPVKVVTAQNTPAAPVIVQNSNPKIPRLTENERKARRITSTSMGNGSRLASISQEMSAMSSRNFGSRFADTIDSQTAQFYSPQLSTDFLEKPQNLRERRAFYRFFYNTNEIVGQAIDMHSTLPLSKLRLVPPKGKNKHQNDYVHKFFTDMCDEMKLFKTLIEIAHEYTLFGNCTAKWAEIKTLTGYKLAQDVEIGDWVLTNKGRYKQVTKKCVRLAEDILRIKCWKDFREIPVTEEHPIEILKDEDFQFEQAGDLSLADYVHVTYPTEICDTEKISLFFPENYKKIENGYELHFKFNHPRSDTAITTRKNLVGWLRSITEPVIKTHQSLADDLGVSLKSLNKIVTTLDQELDIKFHKRIGASGWQKGSQVLWLPLQEVEVTDSYIINKVKFIGAIDSLNINNDFAYLAGYWLGDGTLARDSSRNTWGRGLWQVGFEENETVNIDRVRQILISIFGKDAISEWSSDGMKYLKIISNPAFIEWWSENFGETSFGKNNKRIPYWFVNLPVEKLQNFIAGLIDSDGCVSISGLNKNCIVNVAMTSRAIMDCLRDIMFKCGAVASYSCQPERDVVLPQGAEATSKKMYVLTSSDEESCRILTEFSSKMIPDDAVFSEMNRYWIRTDEGIAFKIKSINTEKYENLVYNFEVEEDHTYQVAGFSTHNCFVFAEEHDWREEYTPDEAAKRKEESQQRSEYLKEKYSIADKDPMFKGWRKLLILPPDQVRVRKLPMTDDVAIEYMPDPETRKFLTSDITVDPINPSRKLKNDIPAEMKEKIRQSGVIPLDTDPYTGSHVFHLARKKSQYEPLGVSMIERCINTLVLMDKLRQAQTSIASRHMTPMRVVWAEGLNSDDLDNLREQVDLALVDPDFSVIANYEIHWEEMGSTGRLLDIEAENESSLNRLFAGLGVTREILTGEGTYTGSRISLEIMNTQYLLFREIIQDYVENNLFKPIARKKGFIEYDDYGNENLLYPRLSFTRLAIRDNEQFFDAAFQLYQKGSISIDLILDILNIDPDSTKRKIEQDLFTVNDSIFNEVMRNLYTSVAAPLVEKTNVVQKLADYLKLQMVEEEAPAEGASRFSSKKASNLPADFQVKLAKVMKYFTENPEALNKVFGGSKKECAPPSQE